MSSTVLEVFKLKIHGNYSTHMNHTRTVHTAPFLVTQIIFENTWLLYITNTNCRVTTQYTLAHPKPR